MKIKCPVALCGWEGKAHQFHKHIEEYKITWKNVMDSGFPRSESHERWANYFFKEIWNDPNLPEKIKWTNIAIAYVNQSKKQNKMQPIRQHQIVHGVHSLEYEYLALFSGIPHLCIPCRSS